MIKTYAIKKLLKIQILTKLTHFYKMITPKIMNFLILTFLIDIRKIKN
jgi:hypothetical protein